MLKHIIQLTPPTWYTRLWVLFFVFLLLRWNNLNANTLANLANTIVLESITSSTLLSGTPPESLGQSAKLQYPLAHEYFQINHLAEFPSGFDVTHLDKANTLLQSAANSCNDCPARIRNLAVTSILSSNDRQAILFLQQYLKQSPNDTMMWKQLGDVYARNGDWIASVQAYQHSSVFDTVLERLTTIGYRESARYYINLGESLANISILAGNETLEHEQFNQVEDITSPAILIANQIESPVIGANLHFLQGKTAYRSGEFELALESFHQVLTYLPNINAYEPFKESYAAIINEHALLPETDTPERPEHLIEQNVGDFFLVGFSVNNTELILGLPLSVRLFWSTTNELPPVCETSDIDKTMCIQDITTPNLVPNAGFEWYPTCTNCPVNSLGFAHQKYKAPPSAITIRSTERNGVVSQSLALNNIVPYDKSGLVSYPIKINPNSVYLQAGWVRSESGGSTWLGRNWNIGSSDEQYEYIVTNYQDDQWVYHASIVFPPVDANNVEIWLLNFDAVGTSYFDDLLFIPILQNSQLNDT